MRLIKNIGNILLVAASFLLLPDVTAAEELDGRWVSNPRALIVIVIGEDGGRILGPEWEYRFAAKANNLDFEIAPGRRLVLRRSGENWVGEYFHPRIRPGGRPYETHSMLFVREKVASR